jgi:PHD/YefM family antitoxin component YafN of YafNO toxin-antitoxin module
MKNFKRILRAPILILINKYISITSKIVITKEEYESLKEKEEELSDLEENYEELASRLHTAKIELLQLKNSVANAQIGPNERRAEDVSIGDDALDDLIKLCHPDKHGDSEYANHITRQLLEVRRKRRARKKK